MDTMATENTVKIKKSVIVCPVAGTQFAKTPTALTLADAILVSTVTVSLAVTLMSAQKVSSIAIKKLCVPIPGDRTGAPVLKDITETAGSVKVLKQAILSVSITFSSITLSRL